MKKIAAIIDHTELSPTAGPERIDALAAEALAHRFHSVCVHSGWVRRAAASLADSPIAVCAVVGFPLGACAHRVKAFEAGAAVEEGATEIDMVIDLGRLVAGDEGAVERDIAGVVGAAEGALVKVIVECARLDAQQIERACKLSVAAGAHFVKTSTGFGPGGATLEDVRLMRSVVGLAVGVKASGGIRDLAAARAMVEAGASRLGCSASVSIAAEESAER